MRINAKTAVGRKNGTRKMNLLHVNCIILMEIPEITLLATCVYIAPIAIRYKNTIGQRIEQIARDDYSECQ